MGRFAFPTGARGHQSIQSRFRQHESFKSGRNWQTGGSGRLVRADGGTGGVVA